jgi:two-component system, sensor histidine kinase and response regulator
MKKILVVEDNETVRNNLIDILKMNQFKVEYADNGSIGYQTALKEVPDLIISDIMMPEMDGYELLIRIRDTPSISHIPFIFLSAKTSYKDLRYGMKLSADDYLTKPFTVKELLDAVNTNLNRADRFESKIEEVRNNIALSIPHELRTPLTAVLGYTEILKDQIESDADKSEQLLITQCIHEAGIRLNDVINKFIVYSETTFLLQDISTVKTLSSSMVESTLAYIQSSAQKVAQKYNQKEHLEFDLTDSTLNCNNKHLIYIVEELIENACKYSQTGSEIKVTSKSINDVWYLSVLDHGMGMTEAQIKSIGTLNQFDRNKNEIGGNGLGLSTIKKMMQIYGGTLKIKSEHQTFTCVEIELPNKL